MDEVRRREEIQKAKATAERARDGGRLGVLGIVGSLVVVLILVVAILQIIVRVAANTSELGELKREVPALRAKISGLEEENRLLRQNLDAVSQQIVDQGGTPNVSFPPGFVNPPPTPTPTPAPTTPPTTPPPTTPPSTPATTTTTAAPPSTTTTTTCLLPPIAGCFR